MYSFLDSCSCWRLEWNGLVGGVWMCRPSRAKAMLIRGTLPDLASMLNGRLNAIRPSEEEDRMNMVQVI